jgi:hypothetical protein
MAGGPLVRRDAVAAHPAPAAKLKLATSLEAAKKDELVLLDRRGGVMTRSGVRRAFAKAYATALLQGVAWGAAMVTAAWLHPLAGLGGLAAYVWFVGAKVRWQVPLKRALALLSARRYDEAHAKLSALDAASMPAAHRPHVKQLLAGVTWVRGDLERALTLFDEAITATRPLRDANAVACRWICLLSRAHLLVVMGRRAQVEPSLGELDDAPPGDFFAFLRQQVALALAFDADDPQALPEILTLHDWARAALLRNRFGTMLVYLAWAFARLGDEDMARLCLGESVERLEYAIDRSHPRLHTWMEGRRAAWADEA